MARGIFFPLNCGPRSIVALRSIWVWNPCFEESFCDLSYKDDRLSCSSAPSLMTVMPLIHFHLKSLIAKWVFMNAHDASVIIVYIYFFFFSKNVIRITMVISNIIFDEGWKKHGDEILQLLCWASKAALPFVYIKTSLAIIDIPYLIYSYSPYISISVFWNMLWQFRNIITFTMSQ